MDLYKNTIPDDHGIEIKKRIRERDDPDDEGRSFKRPRADTSALLPPASDQQEIEEPPKPEDDLDKYDQKRLQQGLRYIDGASKRKITPRTQEFLKIHKEAYKIALNGDAPVTTSRAVVQVLDKVYYSTSFYLRPRSSDEHDHLMQYVRLRRLELLANYGDYLGQELQDIRSDLKAAASGSDSDIQNASRNLGPPKQWTAIADELAGADPADLRKHVAVACGVLGIDSEHMLWLIEEWAQRNRLFHNSIRQYISDCHWHLLAEQISRDLAELLNVATDADSAAKYEKVVLNIQNEYFDDISRDDPRVYQPSEKARKLTQEKLERGKKRAQK